jgi:hypothetical protein
MENQVCTPVVAAKVQLALALIRARVDMSREDVKEYGLEPYVYPLPPFAPRPAIKVRRFSKLRTRVR